MKAIFRRYLDIFVYLLLMGIFLQLFFSVPNRSVGFVFLILAFIAFILLVRRLLYLIKRQTAQLYADIKFIIDKLRLRRIENQLSAKSESWRIRGRDSGRLKLRLGLIDRIRSALHIKARLSLKANASNRERVRYLFTRFILERSRDKGRIPQSATPRELYRGFSEDGGTDVLIDTYELARYDPGRDISDEAVERCEMEVRG